MLELTVRLIVSLAIVIGLLLVLARFGARKFRGNNGALVHVVHRQALSRTSSVSVVTVGTRVLVLGTTEQQISVLAELDPDEIELDEVALDELDGFETVAAQLPQPTGPRLVEEGALAPVSKPPVLARTPGSHRATTAPKAAPKAAAGATQGALAGSILSVQTWRQAFTAARRAS